MLPWKQDVLQAIDEENWDRFGTLLREHPNSIRLLLSGLHELDREKLKRYLHAFHAAATQLETERLLDLNRRLMWLLNEESGNNCPSAALALAEIAQVRPETVLPHLPVLRVYTKDPSEMLRNACIEAVAIIEKYEVC